MAEIKKETIALKAESGTNNGTFYSELPTSGERMARAGKMLGICWGLGLLAVLIPVAHFVLVPLLLILGPILAFRKYQLTEVAEKIEGVCPECQAEVTIEMEPTDRLPKRTYCPACNKPLQLVYHSGSVEQ